MDGLEFFYSPIGIALLAAFVGALIISLRSTGQGAMQRRHTYDALMASAKKRALKKVSVVVPLRRKGATLSPLFAELARQHYKKLEVVVVVYQTAGRYGQRDVRQIAKEHGLTVRTVRHKKNLTLESVAQHDAKGEMVLTLQPHTMLTGRFFERVSYAFMQPIDAVTVRRFMVPDYSITSAYRSLRVVFQQTLRDAWPTKQTVTQLHEGVIVRRQALKKQTAIQAQSVLFDEYALSTKRTIPRSPLLTLAMSVLISAVLLSLYLTTALDLLLYVGAFIVGVFLFTATLFVLQTKGLSVWQKAQLVLVLPFYPLIDYGRLIYASIRIIASWLITVARQSTRQVQRQLQARTR